MDADFIKQDLGYVELGLDGGWFGVVELVYAVHSRRDRGGDENAITDHVS